MIFYEIPIYNVIEGKRYITFPSRVSDSSITAMIKDQGNYTFSCQNLLEPVAEGDKKFKLDWIRYWEEIPKALMIAFCIDPANTIKKRSDYTSISVHGWDSRQNWYFLDFFRDKLKSEDDRALKLFELHRKWKPFAQNNPPALYETIGFQVSDKHNIERKQKEFEYFFEVIEMKGGVMHNKSKMERIKALQPYFESNQYDGKKIYIPKTAVHYSKFHQKQIDMVKEFLYEYEFFTPNNTHMHDDIMDTCTFPLYWDRFKNIKATDSGEESIKPIQWEFENRMKMLEEQYSGKQYKIGYL